MKINCELIVNSDVEHLQQIYAGFQMLYRNKLINLKQVVPIEFLQNKKTVGRWINYNFFNTTVVINEGIRVCYDTHDWNWIDENILSKTDFYFKRSYDEKYLAQFADNHKVFPLGLNYQVVNDEIDLFRLKRAAFYTGKDRLKLIVKSLRLDNFLSNKETERLDQTESPPDYSAEPRALFMARAWDTENILDKSQKELVEKINETRAESIRALRKNFGERFFGGLMRDAFSEKHFSDVLLNDNTLSDKRNYLEKLKQYPICIATTGLNNSIGWKLGEYVAFSKAIVTESLHFRVPGDFDKGKNYLEFTNSEELLNSLICLFENRDLRNEMMRRNHEYYKNFVRPDALVLNSLRIVAEKCGLSFP